MGSAITWAHPFRIALTADDTHGSLRIGTTGTSGIKARAVLMMLQSPSDSTSTMTRSHRACSSLSMAEECDEVTVPRTARAARASSTHLTVDVCGAIISTFWQSVSGIILPVVLVLQWPT